MKPLVCVFAHPDDEAFGPSGSIASFATERDVYIICVTPGDAGEGNQENLGEMRKKELEESANILGVKGVFFLDYPDGTLCNQMYHEIAQRIEDILGTLRPDTLLTFEPRGVSGHIDHIAVSLITTFVFYRLPQIQELMYYCLSVPHRAQIGKYFIYFPPGYTDEQITQRIPTGKFWDQKLRAIRCHASQHHDGDRIVEMLFKLPKEECFQVIKKSEIA